MTDPKPLAAPLSQPETYWMVELDGLTFRFTKGGTNVITTPFTDPLAIRDKTQADAQKWADTLERNYPWMKGRTKVTEHMEVAAPLPEPTISDRQLCLLSLLFNRHSSEIDINDGFTINKWLESQIAAVRGVK